MAYDKETALRKNVEAIGAATHAYITGHSPSPFDIKALKGYTGFGGIKEVLYIDDLLPIVRDNHTDEEYWKVYKEFQRKFPLREQEESTFRGYWSWYNTLLLHITRLANHMGTPDEIVHGVNEKMFKRITASLKNSVLTAFYTPQPVIRAVQTSVSHVLKANGIAATTMLETSAGVGGFLSVAGTDVKKVAVEKDLLTALVGAALNPEVHYHNEGFEEFVREEEQGFDIVASNIPFGQCRVFDKEWSSNKAKQDDVHQKASANLHTFFWVKGIEQLKNGGILAFVTNRGVADAPTNEYLRRWMMSQGHLLAAVRLPDNLFMDGSGIEVGSDLIVFQRDMHRGALSPQEQMFIESGTRPAPARLLPSATNEEGEPVMVGPVNGLLSIRKQALYTQLSVGKDQYGKVLFKYRWDDTMEKLEQELTSRLSHDMEVAFRRSAWMYGHDTLRALFDRRFAPAPSTPQSTSAPSKGGKVKRSAKRSPAIDRDLYDRLLATFITLNTNERINHQPDQDNRQLLNEQYDALTQGTPLSERRDEVMKLHDYQIAFSLERRDTEGNYVKADVFKHPTAYIITDPNKAYSPQDALTLSMNEFGRVNLPYICQLSKQTEEDVCEALKGSIYLMPDEDATGVRQTVWQYRTQAIQGNVIAKAKQCRMLAARMEGKTKERIEDSIRALEAATPKAIPFDDIDIQLGARWLPGVYYAMFIRHLFSVNMVEVEYIPSADTFNIKRDIYFDGDGGEYGEYAVRTEKSRKLFSGWDILSYAMIDKCPTITYGPKEDKRTDYEGMQLVQRMIDKIRNGFQAFIRGPHITEEYRKAIETLYNETFNCNVRAKYDGAGSQYPGLCFNNLGFDDLYASQKDAIMMIEQLHGGVCWHTVGGGKTMIMCVAAYEMRRMGLCHKPIIIGLKANVQQIADTFRKAYPHATLLYPGKEDFTRANRVDFFNKIANNDWDCIIMTHDQFGRIPLTKDVQDAVDQQEIDEVDSSIETLEHTSFSLHSQDSKRIKKGLEQRKASLQSRIRERRSKQEQHADDVLNFRDLGIDFIFVDEYQYFKNLQFTTRHTRVSGLGNTDGSVRANHLLTCIRDIQMREQRDMCAAFFSGTVVTNALTELYVLFKYLRPEELKRQGINCFDAWAATYIYKSTELELDLTNQLKSKERFRTYLNLPELTQSLREITDFRTADMINLDIPNRKDIYDLAEPTAEQKMMLERLTQFAATGCWSMLGLPKQMASANLDKSVMLVATNLARKIALDPRLISTELFHDDPNNKAHRCAKRLAENYREFDAHKGVQFVFTDLSAYDPKKWNICAEIRDILVRDYGIPTEEITFINLHESATAKAKLFDKLNRGDIRIIFGSTQKLGTGVNAQQRAVAVHHLDAPWRPSDLEQRDGRAVRHGNEVKIWGNNEVRIYTYGTEQTLDSYKYNLLSIKSNFISSINTQEQVARRLDEDSCNEEDGMSYAQLKALLSGNEDLLTLAKLEKRIQTLQNEESALDRLHRTAQQSMESSTKLLGTLRKAQEQGLEEAKVMEDAMATTQTSALEGCSSIQLYVERKMATLNIQAGDVVIPASVLSIKGAKSQCVNDLARRMRDISHTALAGTTHIGTYLGKSILAQPIQTGGCVFLVNTFANILRRGNVRGNAFASHIASVTYFDGILPTMRSAHIQNGLDITNHEQNVLAQRQVLSQQFEGAVELMKLREEYDTLNKRIMAELAESERQREDAIIEARKKENADC